MPFSWKVKVVLSRSNIFILFVLNIGSAVWTLGERTSSYFRLLTESRLPLKTEHYQIRNLNIICKTYKKRCKNFSFKKLEYVLGNIRIPFRILASPHSWKEKGRPFLLSISFNSDRRTIFRLFLLYFFDFSDSPQKVFIHLVVLYEEPVLSGNKVSKVKIYEESFL